MKKQQNRKNDDAIVGIFTVVLIISLIVIVLGVIKTVYIPEWMKSIEYQHMNEVSNQFSQMKSAIDIQSMTNGSSVLSSLITLGTTEIPIFGGNPSYDELSILPGNCTISIRDKYGSITSYTSSSIKFSSHNTNFVDQSYIYEAGTLILSQEENNIMMAQPNMLVTEYGKNITLSFINVSLGTGVTNYISGHGIYPIYTQIMENNQHYTVIRNVTNITVKTMYPKAWYQVFNATLLYSGISHDIVKMSQGITLRLLDAKADYFNVLVRQVNIIAKLAFGVVE